MDINSISSINPTLQVNQAISSSNPLEQAIRNSETSTAPPTVSDFLAAIFQSLSQIGSVETSGPLANSLSTSLADSSASIFSPQDVVQALGGFMQSLIASLHSQSIQTGNSANSNIDSMGNIFNSQNDIQSLVQDLALNSLILSDPNILSNSTNTTQNSLDQSFQNLVGVLGGSSDNMALSDFLQFFSSNLSGNSLSGNVINEQV